MGLTSSNFSKMGTTSKGEQSKSKATATVKCKQPSQNQPLKRGKLVSPQTSTQCQSRTTNPSKLNSKWAISRTLRGTLKGKDLAVYQSLPQICPQPDSMPRTRALAATPTTYLILRPSTTNTRCPILTFKCRGSPPMHHPPLSLRERAPCQVPWRYTEPIKTMKSSRLTQDKESLPAMAISHRNHRKGWPTCLKVPNQAKICRDTKLPRIST